MKKEPKASHIFANSDLYRKENVQGAHVIAAKSNLAYNRSNNQYQNQGKIKGGTGVGGQVIGIQEGYFPPGFYAGKHPSAPHNMHHQANEQMFSKHELEFHQKGMAVGQQQFPPQFHAQKYDMHEFEHHNNLLKNDVNHKMIAGTVHGQNQMYYNENTAQNAHHNQYYPNEFDIGSDGANSSGYFDPKSQAHYYDMNYHHHSGNGSGSGNEYPEMYGQNAVNENCENFASFQQYYDHHQQQQQQQQPHPQQNMHHANYHAHVAGQNAYVHHQQPQTQQNFPAHHANVNAQIHGNANLTENSNSSSDFNFLSNLNDFAPEYYQLS